MIWLLPVTSKLMLLLLLHVATSNSNLKQTFDAVCCTVLLAVCAQVDSSMRLEQ